MTHSQLAILKTIMGSRADNGQAIPARKAFRFHSSDVRMGKAANALHDMGLVDIARSSVENCYEVTPVNHGA